MDADLIVVGLGWSGLGVAYYWATQGLKVIGFEKNGRSGELGTASSGETRIWRITHANDEKNKMMTEALKMWRDVEQATGVKLLESYPILNFGHPDSEFLKTVFGYFPEEKIMNGKEIMKMYPALKNIPDYYVGMWTKQGKLLYHKTIFCLDLNKATKNNAS